MNLSHREETRDLGPPRLLFEGFELRLDSGELLRMGSPVKLQSQPAKILEILACRSGEVVSREEIRQLVWRDSYVDFDASLNFCIKEIRRALGDSATSPSFVETVPRRGYRFLKPVTVEPEPPEPFDEAVIRPILLPPLRPEPLRSRLVTVGVTIALLLLLTLLVGSRLGHRASRPRLAVLPLKCRGQATADQQVCGGITEALTAELTRQFGRNLDVIDPSSVLAYQKKSPAEISRGLKANYLLSGAAALDRQGLKLAVRLSPAGGGKPLTEASFPGELKDAPRLYGQIAREVARQLDLPLPPPETKPKMKPQSPAYQTYLRGLYLYGHEEFKPAAEMFQKAVILDPGFALAYAALAQARLKDQPTPDLEVTEAAALHALALEPESVEAHIALGRILLGYRRDWEGARRELQRALALDPGNADAHYQYSLYLAALGRHAEALASAERARELDPASMMVGSVYAWYFYLDHQFDEAIRQGRLVFNLFPLSSASSPMDATSGKYYCQDTVLNSAWKLGDHATALWMANEIQKLFPPLHEVRDLNEFWHIREQRIDVYLRTQAFDPYLRAKNAMALGEPERALDLLTHQCTPEGIWMPFAAVEPVFDPLHSDPRWSQVLDCLKLPADALARQARR
jgi:DNA-binding winged helix-turn-helix (wHTH) protein/TolB-like protein